MVDEGVSDWLTQRCCAASSQRRRFHPDLQSPTAIQRRARIGEDSDSNWASVRNDDRQNGSPEPGALVGTSPQAEDSDVDLARALSAMR